MRLGLIVSSADGQDASFAFAHTLVRQTLLARISVPRRQLLHLRAAEALEQAHPVTESKQAVAIAHHVRQAGILVENQQLVRYLTLTGKSALETTALEQAPS
jgi:predicted ATPase